VAVAVAVYIFKNNGRRWPWPLAVYLLTASGRVAVTATNPKKYLQLDHHFPKNIFWAIIHLKTQNYRNLIVFL